MQTRLGEVPAFKNQPTGLLKTQPTAAIVQSTGSSRLMRGNRHLFSTSHDDAMMKQILATHDLDGDGGEFDVKPLFAIIQNIMHHSAPAVLRVPARSQAQIIELENNHRDILELLAYPINKTSCEINFKCSAGEDADSITMALFQSLSSYSWEAKVIIAFAAFAVNYGEFWLVAQLYTTNVLAQSIAVLKELSEIKQPTDTQKQKFMAVNSLIKAMLDLMECIIKFKEFASQDMNIESPEMVAAAANIPSAVYWIVRSIVACATVLLNHIAFGHEYVAPDAEAWELNSLAQKLKNIKAYLERQMTLVKIKLERDDTYRELLEVFHMLNVDNMKFLGVLIYAKEGQLPLFDGTHNRRSSLDVLRSKHVLLLISDLDISHEELSVFYLRYTEGRQQPTGQESEYEVVWLPVVDILAPWTDAKQKQFELLQNSMPWYSVVHPMMLGPAVIRFIREFWGFIKKPQLVVLDPEGKESNRNAMHMMRIWGNLAFPFIKSREEALWGQETWRIEFLVDSIDQNLLLWIKENKYICLYGGDDIEWIRKFTTTARGVANAACIPLEMLYVGKNNPKERIRRINSIIQAENLSHVLPDFNLIWFFWLRVESMWYSKVQLGVTLEMDTIMQEIIALLSFDSSDQGWAVFARGSHEMAKGKGDMMLQSLSQYDDWKDKVVSPSDFVMALNYKIQNFHFPQHATRLILPGSTQIPEMLLCAECGRPMEKYIMYRCATD